LGEVGYGAKTSTGTSGSAMGTTLGMVGGISSLPPDLMSKARETFHYPKFD
jgi:hypothetical protein